jgi:hypothetical protein
VEAEVRLTEVLSPLRLSKVIVLMELAVEI